MNQRQDGDVEPEIDPLEFLRRALAISPEDAAEVRADAAKRRAGDEDELPRGQHGPTEDYGEGA